MKKRTAVKVISLLSAAVIATTGFLLKLNYEKNNYRLQLENGYSSCLDEFNAAINNITLTLSKARFVTTPEQMSSLAAKLLSEAQTSKTALSQLPAGEELTVLNKFLSQVGNFALAVSKKLINSQEISAEDTDNIDKLCDTANKISEAVNETYITYNNAEYWASELENKLDSEIDSESLSASLSNIEDELSDFPTLVYDGPYSDHILEKKPEMTSKAEAVNENTALLAAAKVAECKERDLKNGGSMEGSIPSYRFVGEGITVTVSKNGGYPVFMRREKAAGPTVITYEQAVTKAKRYLERIGMNNFTATYYFSNEGVCVINFAFVDGETVCYTDLVKVGVAMDDGQIVLYEASGYLTNHRNRTFKTPDYSEEDALKVVSKKLNVNSISMTLIPTDYGAEVRCYEFACTSKDGQEILVFINAETLKEENVLILLKSDGGTLVK